MSEAIIDIATRKERPQDNPASPEEANFILRVLSGAQTDAQIPLRATRYRLGADEECDIVLMGKNISAHHLDMFFADGCLSITRALAPIYLDGQPLNAFPVNLNPMQIFCLGGVALAFGAENGDWPDESAVNDTLGAKSSDQQRAANDIAAADALLPTVDQTGRPMISLALLRQKLGLDKMENIINLVFGAVLAVNLLIIMTAISLHITENPISIAHSAANRLHAHIQSDPAFAHVQLLDTKPRKQLIGYVARTADFNRLHELARAAHTDLNIISTEKLSKSLDIITTLYGTSLSYKLTPGKGRDMHLLLYGIMRSPDERKKMRTRLQRDLPTIIQIKTEIITQKEAMNHISSWITQHRNFSGLTAKFGAKGAAIHGNLLGNFHPLWQKQLQQNPPRLPQGMMPIIDVHFGPNFPGRIVSLVTGENAQIRLAYKNQDATILAGRGDSLKGGFTLKNIARDHITLQWRGRDFIYPLPN